jgi:hypothetical protein
MVGCDMNRYRSHGVLDHGSSAAAAFAFSQFPPSFSQRPTSRHIPAKGAMCPTEPFAEGRMAAETGGTLLRVNGGGGSVKGVRLMDELGATRKTAGEEAAAALDAEPLV